MSNTIKSFRPPIKPPRVVLRVGIDRLWTEEDMEDDDNTQHPLTMSEQWEYDLQRCPPEIWKRKDPPPIIGLWSYQQYEQYQTSYSQIRQERLKQVLEAQAQPHDRLELEDDSDWEQVDLEEDLEWEEEMWDCRNDACHPDHGQIHWSRCARMGCPSHHVARNAAQGPVYSPPCGARVFESCPYIGCVWHLSQKRTAWYFPGQTSEWHQTGRGMLEMEYDGEDCQGVVWETCFHPNCQKHMQAKIAAGFLLERDPDPGKDGGNGGSWRLIA